MTSVPSQIQVKFFEQQMLEMERERMDYLHAEVKALHAKGQLFVGIAEILGDGDLFLRIKKGSLPRKNTPYLLCVVRPNAGPFKTWSFSYLEFRDKHVIKSSSFRPTGYRHDTNSSLHSFVQIGELDMSLHNYLMELIEAGRKPVIVVAEDDPPILYLRNLKDFVQYHPNNSVLNLPVVYDFKQWQPILLNDMHRVYEELEAIIDQNPTTIIQGPPGTGKSYLIAQVCHSYMSKGARICVTSLANKALVEVARKEPLEEMLSLGRIRKTNLSAEERSQMKGIRIAGELHKLAQGELLLATSYQISKLVNDAASRDLPYDVLIIEEASQSFLATLAAFFNLANKVIVVGDPMQMAPIALNEQSAFELHPHIKGAIDGLNTFCFSNAAIAYRMTETRRLTKKGAYQTGVFYNDTLTSSMESNALANIPKQYHALLCPEGGNSWLQLDIDAEGVACRTAVEFVRNMVKDIAVGENFKVAVLSPFKVTVGLIFNALLSEGVDLNFVDVNTIDRVQGITVDFTVLVLPSHHIPFGFEEKRFNVATSRSKNGTLIITGRSLDLMQSPSLMVKEFLGRCKRVVL